MKINKILIILFVALVGLSFGLGVRAETQAEIQALIAEISAEIASIYQELARIQATPITSGSGVVCTSFTYSAWSACSSGTRTRTVATSLPAGCTGGSPVVSDVCATTNTSSLTPPASCHTFNSNLGFANSGSGEVAALRLVLSRENISVEGIGGEGGDVYDEDMAGAVVQFQAKYGIVQTGYFGTLTRTKMNSLHGCLSTVALPPTPIPIACTSFTYSAWSACSSGTRTRTVVTSLPAGCVGGNSILSETCATTSTAQPTITIISPNGGERWQPSTWQKSQTYNITWNSFGVENVSIRVVCGDFSTTIASSIQNRGYYTWNGALDRTPKMPCKIEVSEMPGTNTAGRYLVGDSSDGEFVFYGNPTATITSPNGGENWVIGAMQTIRYSTTEINPADICIDASALDIDGNDVSLLYSGPYAGDWSYNSASGRQAGFGSGSTFRFVATDYMKPGSYKLLLQVYKCAEKTRDNTPSIAYDSSENYFNVLAPLNQPIACTSFTYSYWSACSSGIRTRTVLSSLPAGCTGGSPVVFQSCTEIPPSQNSTNLITVTYPNGGESFAVGKEYKIQYRSSEIGYKNIKLLNTVTNTITTIAPDFEEFIGGAYWWRPTTPGTYKIIVSRAGDTEVSDSSDNAFTVVSQPQITINSPKNITCTMGQACNITWSSVGVEKITIAYGYSGQSDRSTLAMDVPASQGSYPWTIGIGPTGGTYVVYLSSYNGSLVETSTFNVLNTSGTSTQQSIAIISPNGGEVWQYGVAKNITWTSTGIDKVKIELIDTAGGQSTLIAENVQASLGSYVWTPTTNIYPGNYRIAIMYFFPGRSSGLSSSSKNSFTINSLGDPIVITSCFDTDSGKNYNTKGRIVTKNNEMREDYCSSGENLVEYSCKTGGNIYDIVWDYETYVCPNGCSNGACIGTTSSVTRESSIASISSALLKLLQDVSRLIK